MRTRVVLSWKIPQRERKRVQENVEFSREKGRIEEKKGSSSYPTFRLFDSSFVLSSSSSSQKVTSLCTHLL